MGESLSVTVHAALFRQIAEAAWECADPGIQFSTTINKWHTGAEHRSDQRAEPLQRIPSPRQLCLQPSEPEPAGFPRQRTERPIRSRRLSAGSSSAFHSTRHIGRKR